MKTDLATTPFEKVLLYLLKKQGTGVLTVARESAERRFFFINGAPLDLEIPPGDDDFGTYLARKRLVDAIEFQAYEEQRNQGEDPRDLFIKMGCLTPQQFREESAHFLIDRLVECFSWTSAAIVFEWSTSFTTAYPAGAVLVPSVFFRGFRMHLSPHRISAFIEEKGHLYIDRTPEFYAYENHLAAELAGAELLDRIDGLRTYAEIVSSVDADDAAAVLYTLDYLGVLAYCETPKKSGITPPFPIRSRGPKESPRQQDPFEDLGGELSALSDALGSLEKIAVPVSTTAEAQGLSALEEDLKKQWDAIKDRNYYEIFGMTPKTFSFEKLKKAYFEFTRSYGPEKFFASSSEVMDLAEELLSRVSHAYETLTNVVSKENYDELIASQEQAPTEGEDKEFYEKVQFQSGKVLMEQGQYDSAEKAFTNCLNIDPGKPEYHAYQAVVVYNNPNNKGNPVAVKRAKDLVNRSLQLGRLSIAYALKGAMYLDEGGINFAEAEFKKALKLNPNNKFALKNMDLIQTKRAEEKKGFIQRMFT